MADWSALPGDLLSSVYKALNSDIDLLRLRSVCSSWRSSLPPSRKPPVSFPLEVPPLFSPPDPRNPNRGKGYFVVKQSTLYRLSLPESDVCAGHSSDGWLLKVSEPNPNSFSLLSPLSTAKINYPPGILSVHLDLLNYRISEICRSYALDFNGPYKPYQHSIKKVIALRNYFADCDFAVLLLRVDGSMAYWKFEDENWTPVDTSEYYIHDVVIHEGKCYAIGSNGVLVSFDSELNVSVAQLGLSVKWVDPYKKNYLVEFKSDLYMVSKMFYPETEYAFDYVDNDSAMNIETKCIPFKLRIFKKCDDGWINVQNLGDIVLFMGDDVSFGVSALDFGGCVGNCIFLIDECFHRVGVDSVYGDYIGVYDLKLRKFKALSVAQDYAQLFWPPLSWFMACASSSRADLGGASTSS